MDIRNVAGEDQSSSLSRRAALHRLGVLASSVAFLPFLGRATRAVAAPAAATPHTTTEPTGNPAIDQTLTAFEFAPLTTTKLSVGLALLSGPGGNMVVVAGPDGALLVDTGIHASAAKLAKAAEAFAGKPVATVVNTHWHFDHTGGNEFFGRRGARLIAHDNTRARMGHDQPIEAFGFTVPASPAPALPALTFPG